MGDLADRLGRTTALDRRQRAAAKALPLGKDNGAVEPSFVLVSGPAASGKTTLARALAADLGLPHLAKDTIKRGSPGRSGRLNHRPLGGPGRLPSTS
jgi:ATP-dependent protease Clp ATPase subunit